MAQSVSRFVTLVLLLGVPSSRLSAEATAEVHESGLIVETGVRRLFLDVEVVDASGSPIQGLTKADFSLRLNGGAYPIDSVDDLCRCTADGRTPPSSPSFIPASFAPTKNPGCSNVQDSSTLATLAATPCCCVPHGGMKRSLPPTNSSRPTTAGHVAGSPASKPGGGSSSTGNRTVSGTEIVSGCSPDAIGSIVAWWIPDDKARWWESK